MPLSDAKLRTLKPRAKPYKASDGDGLHVLVPANGSRLWRFSYRFAGKQKTVALGRYPELSLSGARRARDEFRAGLVEGRDPATLRLQEKREKRIASGNTFQVVADDRFETFKGRWVES